MNKQLKDELVSALASVKELEDWIEHQQNNGFKVLYHSGEASVNESLSKGIFPDFGDWVEEVLSGAADDEELFEQIKEDEHNHVCYFSEAPDWVSMKASRAHPEKSLHDMTIEDVVQYGQLCVIGVEVDEDDEQLKVAGSKEDNYVEKSHFLFSGEEADSELPFGVERGDIYSHDYFIPDFTLTGEQLIVFLARNYPKANIIEQPLETLFDDVPELSKDPQLDLFKNNVQNFLDNKNQKDDQKPSLHHKPKKGF